MKLICLTGIDGAGKTTLANNLVAALKVQGRPALYLYGRTYPVVSRALMALGRLTLLRKHDQWQDYQSYNSDKKQTMKNPLLAWVYTAAILTDYYIQIWLKLLPHIFSNRTLVLDRYVYDTVISDLTVHLNYTSAQTEQMLRQGLRLLPMPVLTVLIDIPEEVAFARKNDVPHIEYLQERSTWYRQLKTRPEVQQVEGEWSPLRLLVSILSTLRQQESLKTP